jgi:CheY-like chemotaxis protein
MADRTVLCIEPDNATVNEVRRAFTPLGFRIESIPNGEEAIDWGRANPPSLIVLSVEPRKVGYAICNKLKRSPSLRDVPLLLISAEETMATFEQHKKLKSRADDYMLKPLDPRELVAKADRLLGGGLVGGATPPPVTKAADDDEEIEELDADSDILIADDDDVAVVTSSDVEDQTNADLEDQRLAGLVPPEEHAPTAQITVEDTSEQRVMSSSGGGETQEVPPFEPERFDPETQAAFAALEAGSPEGPPTGQDVVDLRNLWSDDDLPAALNWDQPTAVGAKDEDEAVPQPRPGEPEDPDVYRTGETLGPELGSGAYASVSGAYASVDAGAGADDVPPAPDEVFDDGTTDGAGRTSALEVESALDAAAGVPVAVPAMAAVAPAEETGGQLREVEARNAELETRIRSLENERQTLRKDLDEARERFTQSATFSKEREFLGLREIINKKEKDILDLRDALDAKERQILDHKDKIRELERSRRDVDEKMLGFEKNLVIANERVAEVAADREKSGEREKALKSRLDDAHEQLRKSHDEVDALKKRMGQDEVRGRSELDRLRGEFETRMAELEEAHRGEIAKLGEERTAAAAAAEGEHEADLHRLESAQKLEVDALQRRLNDEQAAAAERLVAELGKLRREQEKALAALREEQAAQLASERQAYEALTEQKERDHRNEILGMRRRHEEELAAAEERRQRDIAELEARRVGELDAAEGRRRAELQARDEEQHARITEIERRHLTEKTELSERHRAEYDQALGRAARAEGELAARVQEIEQAYRRLSGLEADLDAARAELGDREVRLGQSRDRLAGLEAKVADQEDQIVRAYQRLRADEKTTEKTRRALAVALALLDERSASGSGPVVPLAGGAPAGAAAPPPAPAASSKPVAEEA